ncbi:hypothetical protein QA942_39750 [Streptomyces sp. B21-106]|uniref:hypothetical protein n=1 Tax=Streptomyces sp. B21-106 TaxID=3039418 RepID=UPI002FF25184
MKIFGFNTDTGSVADLPEDINVESTATLSGGESLTESNGPITNQYETTKD